MVVFQNALPGCSIAVTHVSDGDVSSGAVLRRMLRHAAAFQKRALAVPHLLHGSKRQSITTARMVEADALITTRRSLALGLRVADCLPIVCAVKGRGIAVIHGGWRSLLQNIVPLTIHDLCAETHADPHDVFVWIGPSIQSCCNVMADPPIQVHFSEWTPYIQQKNGMYAVSLQHAVVDQCVRSGVPKTQIHRLRACTYHQKTLYSSYRRWKTNHQKNRQKSHQENHQEKVHAPHLGVVAWMEDDDSV